MEWIKHLFGIAHLDNSVELLIAIERAVTNVEPLLKQTSGYPGRYRKPVKSALEYVRKLSLSVPGPVQINNESYAMDSFVHAIFPSRDFVSDALYSSREIQEYRQKNPSCNEIYALMGMRRKSKSSMGMALSGQLIQQEVPQKTVYFTSHTLESPANSEQQARDQIAWSFFDRLVSEVGKRIQALKQEKQSLLLEIDLQKARLHTANAETHPALLKALNELIRKAQLSSKLLGLNNLYKHFATVLQHPEQYLRLKRVGLVMDSMGVLQNHQGSDLNKPVVFSDLVGFDQRAWTVTLVHFSDIEGKTFATRLEDACRRLSI